MGSVLKDNLQELYYASHAPEAKIALIANWSGKRKRIYYAKRGWGRLWRFFYSITELVTGKDRRLEKLKTAVISTQILFQQQIAILQQALNLYQAYLQKASNEYPVKERDFFAAREIIRKWDPSTAPFVKMIEKLLNPRLEKILKYCFGDLTTEQYAALFPSPPKDILRACKRVIDLEGVSRGPLPLAVFKKVFRGKVLNKIDDKVLSRWIKEIDRHPNSTQYVHRGIAAIAFLNTKKIAEETVSRLNPALLEVVLEDKGCKAFEQVDSRHLQWRAKFKEGSKILFKNTEIVLGKEIYPSSAEVDRTRVFFITDRPQQVVLMANNQAILGIRMLRQRTENDFGIEPAQLLDVSEDGLMALMERLQPLNTKKFPGVGKNLSSEDVLVLKAVEELFKLFVNKEITPLDFSSSSLMFDQNFRLKSLKQMKKGPFDFNALEKFALQWAAGNGINFKLLMENSGMTTHPIAKFYYDSIQNGVQGNAKAPEELEGFFKIKDSKVIERSVALAREAQALHQQVLNKARELYPDRDPKELSKLVGAAIVSSHKVSGAAGILLPHLEQEALKYIKIDFQLGSGL